MRNIISAIICMVALAHTASAQENDSMARKSYAMAEAAYGGGQYKKTVDYIKYAEMYSGGASPRSLYIKIRALNQLATSDASYLPTLQSALDRFFEVTDKNVYPSDKYAEIQTIQNSRRAGGTTSQTQTVVTTPASGKNAEEASDYQIAVKKNTLEGYKEFLDKWSYTPHYGEIKRRYDDMVEDQKEYRNHRIHRY